MPLRNNIFVLAGSWGRQAIIIGGRLRRRQAPKTNIILLVKETDGLVRLGCRSVQRQQVEVETNTFYSIDCIHPTKG